jgi:RHS repeat-associated protein
MSRRRRVHPVCSGARADGRRSASQKRTGNEKVGGSEVRGCPPSFNNGNQTAMMSGATTIRSTSWTSFNLPLTITKGGTQTTFAYGPERQRVKQVQSGPATTIYYGGAIEKEVTSSTTRIKTYLPRGIGFLVETINSGAASLTASATPSRMYLHQDHLGSTIAITDEARTKEVLSYDVWGKRRNADGSDGADTLTASGDRHGYTGHEHLDAVNLIHMNGRVYDPIVGRFVSADPTVPGFDNPQALNRYAYVLNNPLTFTDPSGFHPNQAEADKKQESQTPQRRTDADDCHADHCLPKVEVKGGGSLLDRSARTTVCSGSGCSSLASAGGGVMALGARLDGRALWMLLRVAGPRIGAMFVPGVGFAVALYTAYEVGQYVLSEASSEAGADAPANNALNTDGADSEDQGGDQAKDSKRRFDKGQRERAVDNARDESGEPRCTYCGQKLNDQSGQGNSTEIDHVKGSQSWRQDDRRQRRGKLPKLQPLKGREGARYRMGSPNGSLNYRHE